MNDNVNNNRNEVSNDEKIESLDNTTEVVEQASDVNNNESLDPTAPTNEEETLENNEVVQPTPEELEKKRAEEIKRIEDQGIEIDPKKVKKIGRLVAIVLAVLAIFYIFINPIIKFKSYEKAMVKAAERYYEINPDKVPTGNRTGTVTLQQLFNGHYIEKDFYVPFTKKPCSITKSWVKTRAVNNETKNYVYLYCGKAFQSKVDHKGPVITLNGDTNITINKGEEFKDPGVKSVKDASDGDLGTEVDIDGKVDTNKLGKQTISYTAFDYLSNKTTVTREITVVERIGHAVKNKTKNGLFTGYDPTNYILFGRNLYRVVGLDSNNNVQIVSSNIIGNVNYDALDEYLEDYYNLLPEESKKLIVESKYCNMTITDKDLTTTECKSYTDKRKAYIPSIDLVNKTMENGETYLHEFSWLANPKDKSNAYVITDLLGYLDSIYVSQENNEYFGIKPILTIKGDLLLLSGDGTKTKPYLLKNDKQAAKTGEKIFNRIPGEYIIIDGQTWRILKTKPDTPTKIISTERLKTPEGVDIRENNANDKSKHFTYNPTKKGNIGYTINNKSSRYLNSKYLVKHEIEVPIYKKRVLYKKEVETKKYNLKYSAPDVFELYAVGENLPYGRGEYYHINSSKSDYNIVVTSETGIPEFLESTRYIRYGIKVVSYLDEDVEVVSGTGTLDKPYVVSD